MSSKGQEAATGTSYKAAYPDGQMPPSYNQATGPYPLSQPTFQYAPQHLQQGSYPMPIQPEQFQAVQGGIVIQPLVGPQPTRITCPSCRETIVTRIDRRSSTRTHLFAILCCLVFFPCACLPYCLDSCKDATHYCSNCHAYVGTYSDRM